MFAAVDTNFLLALAAEDEDVMDALQTLRHRTPNLLVSATPTPLAELRFFQRQQADLRLKTGATRALACFKNVWKFHAPLLTPAQQGAVRKAADRLRAAGVLPMEERHDSFILAEAATIGARLLVTADTVLRGIDYARLIFELGEFDLHPPVLVTPRELVRKFFQ